MKSFKESTYWNIWGDACRMHQRYYGTAESNDAAWQSLIQESTAFRNKYKDSDCSEFAEKMVLLICFEINKKSKRGNADAEKKQTQHTAEQP